MTSGNMKEAQGANKSQDDFSRKAAQILQRPYCRLITPDESGRYSAEIVEFPGCFADGETAREAIEALESAAQSWLEAALHQELQIPAPRSAQEVSGRFALRMPKSLHARAAQYAELDGISLNQFIVAAISERVGFVTCRQEQQLTFSISLLRSWSFSADSAHILRQSPIAFTNVSSSQTMGGLLPELIHSTSPGLLAEISNASTK